tara:strand:+ start:501 stop:1178 length:678 start_codon:yes stop_codon:yes gene_type:complete
MGKTSINNINKKKYRGVTKSKNGWIAKLSHKGKIHKSKVFKNKIDAAKSYDRFAKRYHKKNAILNFICERNEKIINLDDKRKKRKKSSKNVIRKKFSIVTRNKICANQKWCCNICNNTLGSLFVVDHIIPLFLGGTNEEYNLQSLCPECDRYKTAVIDYKILLPLSKERVLKVEDVLNSQKNNLWRLKCVNPETMLHNSNLINHDANEKNSNKKILFKLLKLLLD